MPANRFELLTTWYLRFNGYFTTTDFTIHPDYRKRPGGTDADVLAVRFPYSTEYQRCFDFPRDDNLIIADYTDFVICEVKTGACCINDAWLNPERENVQYAIRWMGFVENGAQIDEMAKSIYDTGQWKDKENRMSIRFLCAGEKSNDEIRDKFPNVSQLIHNKTIEYLRDRFKTRCHQIHRENWDKEIIWFAENCPRLSNDELVGWAKEDIGQQPTTPDRCSASLHTDR